MFWDQKGTVRGQFGNNPGASPLTCHISLVGSVDKGLEQYGYLGSKQHKKERCPIEISRG